MENKRELLEIASRLAEFGDDLTIKKVEQILGRIRKKGMTEELCRKEFLKIMELYYHQPDILGGGDANKKRFKEFMSSWLGIKLAGTGAEWEKAELAALTTDQLDFVLGWAARTAKGKSRGKDIRLTYSKGMDTKSPGDERLKRHEKETAKGYSMELAMEEQLQMLASKLNQRKN